MMDQDITGQTDLPAKGTDDLLETLRAIVGPRHVLISPSSTRRFRRGWRSGEGPVEAVVRPGSLVELWRAFVACVRAGRVIIVQAANTGLTGGSTPSGEDYDRPVVVINTLRISAIHLIQDGRQAVCLAGATLERLERLLAPLGREPHSVIGSSCIGASVVGGICNNSGGALVQRGPAYTEYALFARVDADGEPRLVNHLGIDLRGAPEDILQRVEAGDFHPDEIRAAEVGASDGDYAQRVRDIDADTPARFNADPDRLFEASGSAGKVLVFAVRVDTFPKPDATAVFYIGTRDPADLSYLRREMLSGFRTLPIAAEYMHRDCYDLTRRYGKDTVLAVRFLGPHRISKLFALKAWFDALTEAFGFLPQSLADRLLQAVSGLFPEHLPRRMNAFRDRFEHHLVLKVSGAGIAETRDWLARHWTGEGRGAFECTPDEGARALLHRFAAAGAAVRYRALHTRMVENIIALDVALRRNDPDWVERLPADLAAGLVHRLYYGHFFCHVFHQDYVVARGQELVALKHRMLALLDARRAAYPAEHNVGHLYRAGAAQTAHFRSLDPCNCMNPGVGSLSKRARWACETVDEGERPAAGVDREPGGRPAWPTASKADAHG